MINWAVGRLHVLSLLNACSIVCNCGPVCDRNIITVLQAVDAMKHAAVQMMNLKPLTVCTVSLARTASLNLELGVDTGFRGAT